MSDDNLRNVIRDLTPVQQKAVLAAVKEDRKYQGWTNHETWAVNLHLNNEEGWHRAMRDMAAEVIERAPRCSQVKDRIWTIAEAKVFNLADHLKDWVEELVAAPKYNQGGPHDLLRLDLITSAMDEVDWNGLAFTLIQEMQQS